MKTYILLALMLLSTQFVRATHLIGGYIQARPVAGSTLTYEITIALYMNQGTGSQAANQATSMTICFGDGTTDVTTRQGQTSLINNSVSLNLYRVIHTYPGPNIYALTVSMPNRTNAQNITNASFQLFTLNTTISTSVINQTPTPDLPKAGVIIGVNQKATISLKATDTEGDSLAYGLTKSLTSTSNESCADKTIPAYLFPNDVTRQGIFKLNSRTGELVWDAPTQQGNYSIALHVSEYRNGTLISRTVHEITLTVTDLPGTPTTIPPYESAIEGSYTVVTGMTDYVDSDITLTTFPNPVDDNLQLLIQSSNLTTATVQLTDVNGRKLHELQFIKPSRKHEQVISMSSLTPGIYLLCADVDGRSLVRKIVKK